MRTSLPVSLFVVAVAGCGGGGNAEIDAPGTNQIDAPNTNGDGGPPVDAPVANCMPKSGTNIRLDPVADNLDDPLLVTFAPGDTRLFVVEQIGRIRVIKDGELLDAPFLDIASSVQASGERGLLGLAFHPNFATNHQFYVHYSASNGNHTIDEYKATPGTDTADRGTRRNLMSFTDPASNHNGGSIEFGPDGKLYIALGDGGGGGDTSNRAQTDSSLFGKLLRIDVDTRAPNKPYGIPSDNPFADGVNGLPEIWQKGLRNPFRFTFDRANGNIYIGDVGQGTGNDPNDPYYYPVEEIDVAPNTRSINWGWRIREGNRCFNPRSCTPQGLTEPVVVHSGRDGWRSIMGGQVYRGTCFPDLVGTYFYGDYSAQDIWAFTYSNGQAMNDRQVLSNIGAITSIHEDATGELYVTTHNGLVRRIVVP